MDDEVRDGFEVPNQMRSMAQASFDQARKAFEKFVSTAQQTAGSIEERGETVRAGAKDFSTRRWHTPKRTFRHRWTMRSRC